MEETVGEGQDCELNSVMDIFQLSFIWVIQMEMLSRQIKTNLQKYK